MVKETVEITVRLRCYVRAEGRFWVAGCPSLDLYSQGESEAEARTAATEATQLWFDDCLERGTLEAALRELGWERVPEPECVASRADLLEVREPARTSLGMPFPVVVTIPAFQSAALLDAERGAG